MAIVDDYLSLSKALPRSLSKREREIVNVGQLAFELEMSGLSGFLYNISPDASSSQARWVRLRETIDDLCAVGAKKSVRVLESLLPHLERQSKGDGTWDGYLEARGIDLNEVATDMESFDDLFALLEARPQGKSSPPKGAKKLAKKTVGKTARKVAKKPRS